MSIDLTSYYGSLTLKSPVIVGACPLTAEEQTRVAIASAGAGAIVLPSLFEEQVILWNQLQGRVINARETQVIDRAKRMRGMTSCDHADTYLSTVKRASSQMSIPVIASLNGDSAGNWLDFAGQLQAAGAAAIEISVHHPPPGQYAGPRDVEQAIFDLVSKIDETITIPLLLKLSGQYTSLPHLACQLLSGVQGLVLFGRAPSVDICLDSFKLETHWALTPPGSVTESIKSIMRIHAHCPAMSLAVCGGIASATDVIKVLLAGADVAMITSAVYREGPDIIRTMIDGLIQFMEKHHLTSLESLQSMRPLEFDSDEERLEYVKSVSSRLESIRGPGGERAMHGDRWGHPEF